MTRLDRAREFAQAWGSRFVELGQVGHLNPASAHGEWPRAEEFIRELS
ncbi:alpha/beta hydrolase [Cupriavidus necator]